MNKLAPVIFVVLLLCGAALWFLASGSLNPFIKSQIEKVGHQITEQSVTVESVNISLAKGAGSIIGFRLANPASYNYPNAFSLQNITLDINLSSLKEDPIVIDRIIIENPEVFVEITKNGNANLKEILDIIKKNTATDSNTTEKNTSTEKGVEPNLRVSKLTISGTNLALDLSNLGNKEHILTLSDIDLEDIGGTSGLPASELGAEIATQALAAIWQQAKNEQKKVLKTTLKEKALKKLGKLLGNNE